jgi:hypothetical protein
LFYKRRTGERVEEKKRGRGESEPSSPKAAPSQGRGGIFNEEWTRWILVDWVDDVLSSLHESISPIPLEKARKKIKISPRLGGFAWFAFLF